MEFIALREIVESVGSQVSIPDEFRNRIVEFPEESVPSFASNPTQVSHLKKFDESQANHLKNTLLMSYRKSKAAGLLHGYFNYATEDRLRWFDFSATGWPAQSRTARSEVLAILARMARECDRFLELIQSSESVWHVRMQLRVSTPERTAELEDAKRLKYIAFERSQITEFLYGSEIPRNLGNPFVFPWDRHVAERAPDLVHRNSSEEEITEAISLPLDEAIESVDKGSSFSEPENIINEKVLQLESLESGEVQSSKNGNIEDSKSDQGSQPIDNRARGLTTREIADAFDGIHKWDRNKWQKNLSDAEWPKLANIQFGKRGKGNDSRWEPFELAKIVMSRNMATRQRLDRLFNHENVLKPWRSKWKDYSDHVTTLED